jgi:hypothetical protein
MRTNFRPYLATRAAGTRITNWRTEPRGWMWRVLSVTVELMGTSTYFDNLSRHLVYHTGYAVCITPQRPKES